VTALVNSKSALDHSLTLLLWQHSPGWPLVWKTWKCQGMWQLSGKCQGFD